MSTRSAASPQVAAVTARRRPVAGASGPKPSSSAESGGREDAGAGVLVADREDVAGGVDEEVAPVCRRMRSQSERRERGRDTGGGDHGRPAIAQHERDGERGEHARRGTTPQATAPHDGTRRAPGRGGAPASGTRRARRTAARRSRAARRRRAIIERPRHEDVESGCLRGVVALVGEIGLVHDLRDAPTAPGRRARSARRKVSKLQLPP